MADLLNTPQCGQSANMNTGMPSCYFDPQKLVMVLACDPSFRITPANRADIATLKTFLQAQALLGNIYPIPSLELSADNSEDMTISTSAYGTKKVVKDGDYDWMFEQQAGGACYNAVMRSFNQQNKWPLFIDSNMNLMGTLIANPTSGYDIRPVTPSIFYTPKWKVADGSNPTKYMLRIALSRPEEVNDPGKLAYVACGNALTGIIDFPSEVVGNLDINVNIITNVVGTTTVGLTTMCGKVNLYDTTGYPDAFAKATAWIVKDDALAVVTPSGVTKDAVNKGWAVAHAHTGVTYFQTETPTALAALTPAIGGHGANGYKSDILTVTVPAT
jgi:hypothetical protein